MPGFNRKGPQGEGPMTGRSMGKCGNRQRNRINSSANTNVSTEEPENNWTMGLMVKNRGSRRQCQSNRDGFGGRKRRFQ
jgi:hypothetical protein